jgi:SAM-dependent methyltransferase
MDDPTRRFSDRVADYVRFRPGYPTDVVRYLAQACGLLPDWVVADIGAGPGNLARLFLDHGNHVVAVEPNAEMRAGGDQLLGRRPGFRSTDGRAEATTLPTGSVDLVAAGQAFHWFDQAAARTEFARILRPPGWAALVWNERRTSGAPFLEAYERLLLAFGTDYAAVRHQDTAGDAAIAAFFAPAGYAEARFDHRQEFDLEGLTGRLLSSSCAPRAGQPGHEAMLAELAEIFDRHQEHGRVVFPYDTRVYVGRLRPEGADDRGRQEAARSAP